MPCKNQVSRPESSTGENASVALHGQSQPSKHHTCIPRSALTNEIANDFHERLDSLTTVRHLAAERASGVVEVPSTNQVHASVALHGESQPSKDHTCSPRCALTHEIGNDPGDEQAEFRAKFQERFRDFTVATYKRIGRLGTLDNLEDISDHDSKCLLAEAYRLMKQIEELYRDKLSCCVQLDKSDDLEVYFNHCAELCKALAVVQSMKCCDPLPVNQSEDPDENLSRIAEGLYAEAQEVRSRRRDGLRRVQTSGVMRGPSPDRLGLSPNSPTTNVTVEEADDGLASPPQEPQHTGDLNQKRATTILPPKALKSKMSFDVFNWTKKRETELTISGPVGPVIHTGYAAHPLQRTTELPISSPVGPVGHAGFASHVLERVEPPTPHLDSAEGVSSPATTSADAADMEGTTTNPQEQANEHNDRRQSLNTETTNLKTSEKFPSLKKSKSMFHDAKQAVMRIFSSIAWKLGKTKATEDDDASRHSRRMAEGDNFCNPKARFLSGDGSMLRRSLPASRSAECLRPHTPDDPFLETTGMAGYLLSPYSQSSPHIDLTPHKNKQADARIDSSPPSPMLKPPRTVSGEIEDYVDSSYSQSYPNIDLTPYKNKQASTRNDGSPPSMPELPRTVSGSLYSQSSPGIDLLPYKNKQASARIDSSPPPPMPQFSNLISGLAQHPHVNVFAKRPLGSSTPRNHLEPQIGTDGEEMLTEITNGQPLRTSLLSTNGSDNSYTGIGEALTTEHPVVLPTPPHGILVRSENQSFIPKPVKTDSWCSERKASSTSPYRFISGDEDESHMDVSAYRIGGRKR